PERASADETAIARIEQLYPFPTAELTELLAGYTGLTEIVWAQEEPANMGAWRSVRHRVEAAVPPGVRLGYVGRPWPRRRAIRRRITASRTASCAPRSASRCRPRKSRLV